jgi:hypothetical protein
VTQVLNEVKKIKNFVNQSISGTLSTNACDSRYDQTYAYGGLNFEGIQSQIEALSDQLEDLRQEFCRFDPSCPLPVHWNTPINRQRSQLVLALAPSEGGKLRRANTSLVIPNWTLSKSETEDFRLSFSTGNYLGTFEFTEGGKIAGYFSSEGVGVGVFETIIAVMGLDSSEYSYRVALKHGNRSILSKTVFLKFASFYPNGRNNTVPAWRIDYTRLDPI